MGEAMNKVMNWSIRVKLLGGFIIVAAICSVVGAVGWYGALNLKGSILEIGGGSVPATRSIGVLQNLQTVINVAERTLLNPLLDSEKRQVEYQRIEGAFQESAIQMQVYESVPHQQETLKIWQDFRRDWDSWQVEVEVFLQLSHEIDGLQIRNPQKFALELEKQFGLYRAWAAGTIKAVLERTVFTGNLDPKKSTFGQWLVSVEVANQEASKAISRLQNQLISVYQAASSIADFMEIEEYDLASDVYIAEVLPSIESIQIYVNDLMQPINRSLALYEQMAHHEQEVLTAVSASTKALLNVLVEETETEVSNTIIDGQNLVGKVTLALVVITILGGLLALLFGLAITRSIVMPLDKAVQMIKALEGGNLDNRLQMTRLDEIGVLAKSMDAFADNLKYEVLAAFQKLADGDFTFAAKGLIKEPLAKANVELNKLMGQIKCSGEQISSGSTQISESSQSLSQGASEQATSLEEITSSLTEMAAQTKDSAENATLTNQLSDKAKETAENGNQQMKTMVKAMAEINDSGRNISKIIKAIDEIAFQTNLLALNAAIEAARAGKHGKGFAVVAEEVRELAARSAKAAKETEELIEGSVKKTENGSAIAIQTAEALEEIVNSINEVTILVDKIAISSNEQAQGISQINTGLSQIDRVTQQNTANAEESAAAAEELSSQANELLAMLRQFKLMEAFQNRTKVIDSRDRSQEKLEYDQESYNSIETIELDDREFGKY